VSEDKKFNIEFTIYKQASETDATWADAFLPDINLSKVEEAGDNEPMLPKELVLTKPSDLVRFCYENQATNTYSWTLFNRKWEFTVDGNSSKSEISYEYLIVNTDSQTRLNEAVEWFTNPVFLNDKNLMKGQFKAITSNNLANDDCYDFLFKEKKKLLADYLFQGKFGKQLSSFIFGLGSIDWLSVIPNLNKENPNSKSRRFYHSQDNLKFNYPHFSPFPSDDIFKNAPIYRAEVLPSGCILLQLTKELKPMERDEEFIKAYVRLYKYLFSQMLPEYQEAFKTGGINSFHEVVKKNFKGEIKEK
jgi:hypothetical protein